MHTDNIAQFIVDLMHDHVAHCDAAIPHIAQTPRGADIDLASAVGSTITVRLDTGETYRIEVIREG